MDATHADGWSEVAPEWAELWGVFAAPAHEALIAAAGVGPGTRVLDVGCGTGEFLRTLTAAGAAPVGVDPAPGMRRVAAAAGADVRDGDAERLPFPDASFDVVTAVNALTFAEDTTVALREFARVLVPGGRVAVANWAEGARNDLEVIERAVAAADESELPPDGPLRLPGGLSAAFVDAGLDPAASGIVPTLWTAPDADALVRGVLLGEDQGFLDEMRPVILAAAEPFRDGTGYRLRDALRWAVARVP